MDFCRCDIPETHFITIEFEYLRTRGSTFGGGLVIYRARYSKTLLYRAAGKRAGEETRVAFEKLMQGGSSRDVCAGVLRHRYARLDPDPHARGPRSLPLSPSCPFLSARYSVRDVPQVTLYKLLRTRAKSYELISIASSDRRVIFMKMTTRYSNFQTPAL